MGNQVAQSRDYLEPQLPDGVLEVRVSVYKLNFPGASFLGAYHSGLVVAGQEWAYGGHSKEGLSGVYYSPPERDPNHSFYRRIIVGELTATKADVEKSIRTLASSPNWRGTEYQILEHNCNHFTSDLMWLLMKRRPPDWINKTAETMNLQARRTKAEQGALAEAIAAYREEYDLPEQTASMKGESEEQTPVWLRAFQLEFAKTFEIAWKEYYRPPTADHLPANRDPQEAMQLMELGSLSRASLVAASMAFAVATASRMASGARALQPKDGLFVWDTTWQRESATLVKAWRERAVQLGKADRSKDKVRAQQVEEAMARAAEAAQRAADDSAVREVEATLVELHSGGPNVTAKKSSLSCWPVHGH